MYDSEIPFQASTGFLVAQSFLQRQACAANIHLELPQVFTGSFFLMATLRNQGLDHPNFPKHGHQDPQTAAILAFLPFESYLQRCKGFLFSILLQP